MIASMDDDDRTKMKKIDLIQQATTRLRRKQLEEQLSDMMTGLTNIQTQSKYLYGQLSGAMATTQQLTDYDLEQQHEQMDLLENQAKLHQAILQQWFPFMSSSTMDCDIPMDINDDSSIVSNSNSNNECNDMNDTKTTTMSRLSSLSMISSLFSRPISRSTSISEFTDMDSERNVNSMGEIDSGNFSTMEQQWNQLRRYQRRLRIKNHRQKHQHRQLINGDNEDRDNVLADLAMASTAFSTPSKKRNENGKHQSISSLPLTNPCQLPPQSAVATTSPVALSLKPVHPHQLEVASTIPLPSPPLSPMSFSCTCRSPSSQEKGYHHDNEDTLSLSSYSRYEFISDDGKSDTSDDGQYHQHYQKTSSPSSPSSLSAHHPLSSSSDETNDWHPQNSSDAAFDDTMDMLDQMAQDGYDEHFFQDMAFLLDHPDICSQPLADLAPLLEQQHHHLENGSSDDKKDRRVTSPSGWAHGPSSVSTTSPYIQHLCSSGWQWYRFVSILSASYVVSLLKGPDDLLED